MPAKPPIILLSGILSFACTPPTGEKRPDPEAVRPQLGSDTENENRLGGVPWTFERSPLNNATTSAKMPFGLDALYQLRELNSPRWSKNAQHILFTVKSYGLAKGSTQTNIYQIGAHESHPIKMTHSAGDHYQPVWLPDGQSFVFVSQNEGTKTQLMRMSRQGGKPHQLLQLATGIQHPQFTRDGQKIVFSSRVFPQYGADEARNSALLQDIKKSPVQAHIADHLLYRHWNQWSDQRRNHILVYHRQSQQLKDVTPGDFDSPIFSFGRNFALSPESTEICFASNRESADKRSWTTNADLWLVSTDGGAVTGITNSNPAHDAHPSYSKDGKYIAFLRQNQAGYEADLSRLALYHRATKKVRILTEHFDNQISHFEWLDNSQSIRFVAQERGRTPLYDVQIETGQITPIAAIPSVREFAMAADGKMAFTYNSVAEPDELFCTAQTPEPVVRLTALNQAVVKRYDARPAEEMWIKRPDGQQIHTFVVKPFNFRPGKKYPLIINIHGGPQLQWTDTFRGDWQIYPAAGYVVAFPNPTGSTGYGSAFTAAISKNWGGRVFDDIMAVTETLASLPYIDTNRIGAMGWSYGGYLVNWIMGKTNRFKAIASMMGIFDLATFHTTTEELWFPEWDIGGTPWQNPKAYARWNPAANINQFCTPTLIITGERDFRIPYTQSLMLFTALKRRQIPARLIVFPNDGHWPNRAKSMPLYYAAHLDWFHQYLGGDPSPYDPRQMIQGRAFSSK